MAIKLYELIARNKRYLLEIQKNIGDYIELLPLITRSLKEFELMENAEKKAPEVTSLHNDERLFTHLEANENSLSHVAKITMLPKNFDSIISTAGSSGTFEYVRHVDNMRNTFIDNHEVLLWADDFDNKYQSFRDIEKKSNQVNQKLFRINPNLATLHQVSIKASLSAATGVLESIEAAANLRELIDQFKGELLKKCKDGKGSKYSRIAQNIIVDSDATITAVKESQETYDKLHSELSQIKKRRKEVSGIEMLSLLRQVEDHIWIIINAIDPSKSGFDFS